MPSYEPTPRRFSVISVSRTSSRRNSIDDASRLTLAVTGTPGFPPLTSPLELAGALKQFPYRQESGDVSENEGDGERGRSRRARKHRRSATAWTHDPVIKSPTARRDSSASTRERIAIWEERSRSQSMGRSKSRGRDHGPGSRISVVPEMPELPVTFFGQGGTDNTSKQQDSTDSEVTYSIVSDTLLGIGEQSLDEGNAWKPTFDGTENKHPHTPPNHHLIPPPTPDVTPGKVPSSGWDSDEDDEELQATTPETPNLRAGQPPNTATSTGESPEVGIVSKGSADEGEIRDIGARPSTPETKTTFPLTPDATPRRKSKISTLGVIEPIPLPVKEENEGRNVSTTADSLSSTEVEDSRTLPAQTNVEPRLPPQVPAELEDSKPKDKQPASTLKTEIPSPHSSHSSATPEMDREHQARYHDVWKITDYKPEFPLPSRSTVQLALDHDILARAPFDGNPLQPPPQSQRSTAAAAYRPPANDVRSETTTRDDNSYSYSTSTPSGIGDWVVDIPPSPTSAYIPNPQQLVRQTRPQAQSGGKYTSRSGASDRNYAGGEMPMGVPGRERHEWDAPSVIQRAFHAASVSLFQGLNVPMGLYRGLRDVYYPPPERPDIIKAYPIRPRLPIRIFFPAHYDLTSPALLPTLFTIHGGGFTIGLASDDDLWNRTFADTYTILVIALNYPKAPWAAFPAPLYDVEALYHAVLNDESLPIDRMRTALCGFDAGANLTLALAQLPSVKFGQDPNPLVPLITPGMLATSPTATAAGPNTSNNRILNRNLNRHRSMYFPTSSNAPLSLPAGYRPNTHVPTPQQQTPFATPRSHPPPSAVIPICGILDFTAPGSAKSRTRPYKRALRGPRGWGPGLDWMARLLPSSAWSYIPYGHDLADPLLSPAFADRGDLPPHVFVVAAELDCLAHESWRAACRWAAATPPAGGLMAVPDGSVKVGRPGVSRWRGCLDDGQGLDGGKFEWVCNHGEDNAEGSERGSTKWLLVPDVVHGFDSAPLRNRYLWGDEEARMDAEMKTIAYQREMAEWLWGTVWK